MGFTVKGLWCRVLGSRALGLVGPFRDLGGVGSGAFRVGACVEYRVQDVKLQGFSV